MQKHEQDIIAATKTFVKQALINAEGGHDWWHIYRVSNIAKTIAISEKCSLFLVELAALLHDIADSKFHHGDEEKGWQIAKGFLESQHVNDSLMEHVLAIIKNISFKGGKHKSTISSIEFYVVQDADRLDAMGAIGIARTFNYGGFKNREIYNPDILPKLDMTREEYKNSTAPTLNHFYEKLLLLKEGMHTSTAKAMAEKRHAFMEQYLQQFYKEWEGKL